MIVNSTVHNKEYPRHPEQGDDILLYFSKNHQSNWNSIRCSSVTDEKKNLAWFISETEAFACGWKKVSLDGDLWHVWVGSIDVDLLQDSDVQQKEKIKYLSISIPGYTELEDELTVNKHTWVRAIQKALTALR